ncbi:MAG: hypothetical protein NVS9B7_21030 [Flavisolibacter sp.]
MVQNFDCIIIGAGAAGLMGANEIAKLGKTTALIEARERIGGRIHTLEDKGFDLPIELGAEFVLGKLALSLKLLKLAGIDVREVKGDIFKKGKAKLLKQDDFLKGYQYLEPIFKKLKSDTNIHEFLIRYLKGKKFEALRSNLRGYIEGYYAADTTKASVYAWIDEMKNGEGIQYRPRGGMGALSKALKKKPGKRVYNSFFKVPSN